LGIFVGGENGGEGGEKEAAGEGGHPLSRV
jgi:hypothetical protein